MLGGDDEVALVLAVFLVDEDDHLAGLEVGDDVLYGTDAHGGALFVAFPMGPRILLSQGLSIRST